MSQHDGPPHDGLPPGVHAPGVHPDNVVPLPGTIAALRRELPRLKEYAQIKAEMGRAYYDALLAEGFTPEEALYLVAAQAEAE